MFENDRMAVTPSGGGTLTLPAPPMASRPTARGVTPDLLCRWGERLRRLTDVHSDAERIDLIRALEELKNVAAATQARLTVAFAESQEEAEATRRRDPRELGKVGARSVAAQVALARRESPHRGQQLVALARGLTQMPRTRAAFGAGLLSEHRASLLVSETNHLLRADREAVDTAVAGDTDALEGLGTKALVAKTRQTAYRLDPAAAVARSRRAESERCVTLRPAPDTMTYLTALLPMAQGVATYANLVRAADSARGAGDPRSRGQVMADTLVQRCTGQPGPEATPVEINLVLTDHTLFGLSDEPAVIPGHGPVPAPIARRLVTKAARDACAWLRRLYAEPDTGQLVTMDSRRRTFTASQAHFLGLRDQTCRTPYCDAPVRHIDHVIPSAEGGPTALTNGQGLCEACNHTKQTPGWRHRPMAGGGLTVTSPTGHRHTSRLPPARVSSGAGRHRGPPS